VSAGLSPSRAASAVREFERTATFMPMKPAAADRLHRRGTRRPSQPSLLLDADQENGTPRPSRSLCTGGAGTRGAFADGAEISRPLLLRLLEQPEDQIEAVPTLRTQMSARSTGVP